MRPLTNHAVAEAAGYYDGIPMYVGDFRLEQNVYGALEWSNRTESVFCRRVGDQWQALVVRDGRTRTLLPGLGSRNHALWLGREYMEFEQTYESESVWSELPSREQANPFRDLLLPSRDTPRPSSRR